MKVREHTFKIVGISPLVMNSPKGMQSTPTGTVKKKVIPTPEVEAAAKVYRLPSGDCYIPSEAFVSAMRKIGTTLLLKIDKVPIRNVLAASIKLIEPETSIFHPKTGKPIKDYEIYTCRAVVQQQGVVRSRPRIPEWAAIVRFEIDEDVISSNVIAMLLSKAGNICGVGDQRPGAPKTPGPYGRFLLVEMDGVKYVEEESAETKEEAKPRRKAG